LYAVEASVWSPPWFLQDDAAWLRAILLTSSTPSWLSLANYIHFAFPCRMSNSKLRNLSRSRILHLLHAAFCKSPGTMYRGLSSGNVL
jgi:hypothetical protein